MSLTTTQPADNLLTRRILASDATNDLGVASLRRIFKKAYEDDDFITVGLLGLHALAYTGAQGNLWGTPMEVITDLVKKRSSKLNKLAIGLAKAIFKNIPKGGPELETRVIQTCIERFSDLKSKIKQGLGVPEAMKFFQTVARNAYIDAYRSPKSHGRRIEVNNLDALIDKDNWASIPKVNLKRFLESLEDDIDMYDSDGVPRMKNYIMGILEGESVSEIARQMQMSPQRLSQWVADREEELKEHLAPAMLRAASVVDASYEEVRVKLASRKVAMSWEESLATLGFPKGSMPTSEEINSAYRAKFIGQRSHPDQGGSADLAMKLNIAKDTLLGKLRPDRGTPAPQGPSPEERDQAKEQFKAVILKVQESMPMPEGEPDFQTFIRSEVGPLLAKIGVATSYDYVSVGDGAIPFGYRSSVYRTGVIAEVIGQPDKAVVAIIKSTSHILESVGGKSTLIFKMPPKQAWVVEHFVRVDKKKLPKSLAALKSLLKDSRFKGAMLDKPVPTQEFFWKVRSTLTPKALLIGLGFMTEEGSVPVVEVSCDYLKGADRSMPLVQRYVWMVFVNGKGVTLSTEEVRDLDSILGYILMKANYNVPFRKNITKMRAGLMWNTGAAEVLSALSKGMNGGPIRDGVDKAYAMLSSMAKKACYNYSRVAMEHATPEAASEVSIALHQ